MIRNGFQALGDAIDCPGRRHLAIAPERGGFPEFSDLVGDQQGGHDEQPGMINGSGIAEQCLHVPVNDSRKVLDAVFLPIFARDAVVAAAEEDSDLTQGSAI